MKSIAIFGAVLALSLSGAEARAALIASAVISAQQDGPLYDYSITLTNSASSTVDVGTFWFGWVPFRNFLTTAPTSVTSPAGWSFTITHVPNSSTDGFGVRWVAGSAASPDPTKALAPGSSLTFGFTSADAPTQVFGNSSFYPADLVRTSFVYQGGPLQGESSQFVATAVPEPASLALAALGVAGGGAVGLRRVGGRRPGR
ncbi:PEP-CTERM sorting domain-containing protein [Paludisphaera mucosa]|uniref:PEP-CTERM sorting domain-containing protein n=1 Tax=Paludisphaera mucosa TaxID=3030827 RepID=A0ABT6FCF7_9BACT|nr:PEP-CTERM sorting domain-containing protein [Paludisphaera mucosa]MDG3005119.1 PEP-CTERM sorting domain-containing protein [Paludisphaera mucosa]